MSFLPLHDGARTRRSSTYPVTIGLVALCTLIHFWQTTLEPEAVDRLYVGYGSIPAVFFGRVQLPPELEPVPAAVRLLTATFLHAHWLHLILNMLFLWSFGAKVEMALGHFRFLIFYLASGVLSMLADAYMRSDALGCVIGASGAVSGVLGAFLLLHPRAQLFILLFFIIPLRLPAWVAILGFMAIQLAFALVGDGFLKIAWWAHIGGFVAGLVLLLLLRPRDVKLFGHAPGPWGY